MHIQIVKILKTLKNLSTVLKANSMSADGLGKLTLSGRFREFFGLWEHSYMTSDFWVGR